jgi:hypothetical protein
MTYGAAAARASLSTGGKRVLERLTNRSPLCDARGSMRTYFMGGPWVLAASLGILTGSSPARAEPTDQGKALATTLFDEGRALLAGGKVSEACRKLEESARLDPLPGTILNLAACHEQEGLTASAVAEFRQARALAERDHRADRVMLADQHLRALEPRISSLVIAVAPEADRPDLVVTHDGTPVGRAAWGSRIPVDPGEHTIEATAPNRRPWKATVNVLPNGDTQTVTLPRLEDAPPAPVPAPAPLPPILPLSPQPAGDIATEHHGLSTRRTLALVSAGVGVLAVGTGSYFGVSALEKHGDPAATCTTKPCSASISLNNRAKFAADAATVSFAVGLAGLGAAAFLWFGDTSARGDRPAVSVRPAWSPGQGGVDVSGTF